MLEWCFQWDDADKYIEDHYKNIERKQKDQREQTEKELEDLLVKQSLSNDVDADNHVWKRAS